MDPGVVGGVGDHRQVGTHEILHSRRQLRATGSSGEQRDPHQPARGRNRAPRPTADVHHSQGSSAGRPVIRIPACALYRTLIEISIGVSCSTIRAVSSRPALTARSPGISSIKPGDTSLVGLSLSADQDVFVDLGVGVGEHRGADRVKRGDHRHPVGRHLLRLLGRRALPDAQRAGRLAPDGRGGRDRAVDQDLARRRALRAGCSGSPTGRGTAPSRRRSARVRGLLVDRALDLGVGHVALQAARRPRRRAPRCASRSPPSDPPGRASSRGRSRALLCRR